MKPSFIITGANGYLGKAILQHLLNKNAGQLLITSRSVSKSLSKLRSKKLVYLDNLDLSKEEAGKILYDSAKNFFKGQFHVINCTGSFTDFKAIDETNLEIVKQTFDSNFFCVYNTAHYIIPLMKKGGGSFITFSSHTNYQHFPLMVAFTAAKQALEALSIGIANEYSGYGIHSNILSLATLNTKAERKIKPNGDKNNWLGLKDVAEYTYKIIIDSDGIVNGNIIHLYKYSSSYFRQSFFDRIKGMNN